MVVSVNRSKNTAIIKEDFQILCSIINAGVQNGDFDSITSWDIVGQNGAGSITNYFNQKLNATRQCLTGDSSSQGCKFPGGNRPGAGHNNHNGRWVLPNGSMLMFHHVGAVEIPSNGTVTFTIYAQTAAPNPNEYGTNPDVVFPRCNLTQNVVNTAGLRLNPGQCSGYDGTTWTPLLNAAMGLR